MGLNNYPFAMAPGMGLNAFFAYTVVLGMGLSWQGALMAVFVSGVIFLILTLTGLREALGSSVGSSAVRATRCPPLDEPIRPTRPGANPSPPSLQKRTAQGQQELRQLERNVLALRSGDVVISTGQPLTMAKVSIPKPGLARQATEDVLRQANVQAYQQVLPGLAPERQLLTRR